jgi:hypothetical protein
MISTGAPEAGLITTPLRRPAIDYLHCSIWISAYMPDHILVFTPQPYSGVGQ